MTGYDDLVVLDPHESVTWMALMAEHSLPSGRDIIELARIAIGRKCLILESHPRAGRKVLCNSLVSVEWSQEYALFMNNEFLVFNPNHIRVL